MSEQPVIFADTVQEANIAYGVARLRLGQVASGGTVMPAGTLIVPLQQLPGLAQAVASVLQQLEERSQPGAGSMPAGNEPPAVDSSFG